MPINETEAEKHRKVQDQKIYRATCRICGREYYTSLISRCPERDRNICMYCCRMCPEHYTLPGQIGQRCRAKDRARAAAKGRGKTSPPPASGTSPEGEAGKEEKTA